MASVDDVDTLQAVGKFLQRQAITPKADNQANTADEIQAVLETVAMAFLLYPQAALTLIINAKNSLQQVVQADLSVIEFLLLALADVDNRDIPIKDSSDLVEAQTALVELDRLGRVDSELRAFGRYQAAVNRFLDDQLGPTLKRNGTGTFERTGEEARQDIFSILSQFTAAHTVMANLLTALAGSIDDFRSVNLTNLVSSTTIARVRSSLSRVKARIEAGTISKTTAAIELLSGAASLTSISNTGDLFDPVVQTGIAPPNTSIVMQPEDVKATVLSTEGPWSLGVGPWVFEGTMDPLGADPQDFAFEIPGPGAGGLAYVSSEDLTATFNVPVSGVLYLFLEGAASPEFEIALTSGGAVPIATLILDIDTALGADGSCIQNPSTLGFLIHGSSTAITSITVRAASTGSTGTYNLGTSQHALLGFVAYQSSLAIGTVTAESLDAAIHNQLPSGVVTVENARVRITSDLDDSAYSSILFSTASFSAVQESFGFSGTTESQPSYLELIDGEDVQIPDDIGVYIGSIVTTVEDPEIIGSEIRTLNNEAITDIQDTRIYFDASVPLPRRNTSLGIEIYPPIVSEAQRLVRDLATYVGTFDEDAARVQRILSSIVSKPTRAQIGDATRVIEEVQTRLEALQAFLGGIEVRTDRSQFATTAAQILSALEERGLDRAQELLSSGQFSMFFSLTSANSSKSNRLLTAMETVARQDLPVSTSEVDIDDDQRPRGTNPDSSVLAGVELEGAGSLAGS